MIFMFKEPTEKEMCLLPLVVHGVKEHTETKITSREAGLGTCGMISLCLEGEGIFTNSLGHVSAVRPGDMFFFMPETPHGYKPAVRPWKVLFILFSGCELSSIYTSLNLPTSGMLSVDGEQGELLRSLVWDVYDAYKSDTASRHITASVRLHNLLTLMSICCTSSSKNIEADVQRLMPAVQYIKTHCGDCNLTAEMIDAHSGMSHPHLCRLFQSVYGMTPHDFLQHARVGKAKVLLTENKDMPIRIVATKSGFGSVSYFTKVFKAKTGFTPAQFRHQAIYNF